MYIILRNLLLLTLVLQSALVTVPGFGRAKAIYLLHETETPTQNVENLEFVKAELARQTRRSSFDRRSLTWTSYARKGCRGWNLGQPARTASFATKLSFSRGHRLHNGLLAPLRI